MDDRPEMKQTLQTRCAEKGRANQNRRLRALVVSRSGSISMIFTFSLLLLAGAVGLAVDYSRTIEVQGKAQLAADASILSAVKTARSEIEKYPNSENWKRVAEKQFEKMYLSNLAGLNVARVKSKTSFANTNGLVSGKAEFNGAVQTTFMQVIGIDTVDFGGKAEASTGYASHEFMRLNFLIDVSNSMGIGATHDDQRKMVKEVNCAFACHYNDTLGYKNQLSLIRSTGARLRIDSVKEAAKALVEDLSDQYSADPAKLEVATYTFSNSLNTVNPGTVDPISAIAALSSLEITGQNQQGATNIAHSLDQFHQLASLGGDGSSASSRKVYTVLVTDGIENTYYMNKQSNGKYGYKEDPNAVYVNPFRYLKEAGLTTRMQLFNTDSCSKIKSKNHKMVIIDLEYFIDMVGYRGPETKFVKNNRNNLQNIMKKCVGDENYITGKSNDEIVKAFSSLLPIVSVERLIITK